MPEMPNAHTDIQYHHKDNIQVEHTIVCLTSAQLTTTQVLFIQKFNKDEFQQSGHLSTNDACTLQWIEKERNCINPF